MWNDLLFIIDDMPLITNALHCIVLPLVLGNVYVCFLWNILTVKIMHRTSWHVLWCLILINKWINERILNKLSIFRLITLGNQAHMIYLILFFLFLIFGMLAATTKYKGYQIWSMSSASFQQSQCKYGWWAKVICPYNRGVKVKKTSKFPRLGF